MVNRLICLIFAALALIVRCTEDECGLMQTRQSTPGRIGGLMQMQCSGNGEGCMDTKCCTDSSKTCFQKGSNANWADCYVESCPDDDRWKINGACVPLSPEPPPTAPPQQQCSNNGAGCMDTKCCTDSSRTCFQKGNNANWADCYVESCPEDDRWKINGACVPLSPDPSPTAPPQQQCSNNGAGCMDTKCCTDSSRTCFQKGSNANWADCYIESCPDDDRWKINGACVPLSPGSSSGRPTLRKGWNLGNTLERQDLQNPGARAEWIFESVQQHGFDFVRIPVRWGEKYKRRPDTGPANAAGTWIDQDFMDMVVETVDWAIGKGLVVLINAHHEHWFDYSANRRNLNRLVNIWKQVALRFQNYPDNQLVFEIFNEPHHMSLRWLNRVNHAVLPAIRSNGNPTRLVFLGGKILMHRKWITQNPDALTWPADDNVGLTVHSYDPWNFAGMQGSWRVNGQLTPRQTNFPLHDQQEARDVHAALRDWAHSKNIKQVVLNEFGVSKYQSNTWARKLYYEVNSQACVDNGQGYAIWDDDGWFQILNRATRQWNMDVLNELAAFPPDWQPLPSQ